MSEFKPLDYMRALRADTSLTTTQFALLVAAVLRTDNSSCRVKMSIEGLAKDAKMSDKTARTAIKAPQVEKYFRKIERTKRTADFWFYPEPVMVTASENTDEVEDIAPEPVTTTASAGNSVHRAGNSYRPSAFPSAFTASTSDSACASSHDFEESKVREEESSPSLNSIEDEASPNSKDYENGLKYLDRLLEVNGANSTACRKARQLYEDSSWEPKIVGVYRAAEIIRQAKTVAA